MNTMPLTILIVDDDEAMLLCLATILQRNGYTVLEARDGAEATAIIRERDKEIAVVISDMRMPHIDGLQLAQLNFQNEFRPFIAHTSVVDALSALRLLKFGVQDYLVKPVEEAVLLNIVRNVINRRQLPRFFEDDEQPFPGNIGNITISATFAAIERVNRWLDLKVTPIITEPAKRQQFLGYASELLINAYEHGSLRLSEGEKTALLESGEYYDELRRRELECKARIEVVVSIVGNEIAVTIIDSGPGFDYKRYQKMSDSETLDRLTMPNGRGIQMSTQYFDSVTFIKGGAGVEFTKKIPPFSSSPQEASNRHGTVYR